MAGSVFRRVVSLCAAGSLAFGSTAASAAATVAIPQASPWAVLTAMSSGAPAAIMCGTAASASASQAPAGGCVLPALDPVAAAPAAPAAPAVPVAVAAPAGGAGISPLLLGLLAIAAGVGIFAAAGGGGNKANSPA